MVGHIQLANYVSYFSWIHSYAKIMTLQQWWKHVMKWYFEHFTFNEYYTTMHCIVYVLLMFFQDAKKEYLEKKERGELAAQKVDFLRQNILQSVNAFDESVTTMSGWWWWWRPLLMCSGEPQWDKWWKTAFWGCCNVGEHGRREQREQCRQC